MNQEDKLLSLVDQATDALLNDSADKAAQALQELAYMCKQSRQLFEQLRKMAIMQAENEASNVLFIREKLATAETKLREKRNGSIIIH